MKDFLTFRRMLSPILLQIVFWAGLVACVVTAVTDFWDHAWLQGLLVLVLGPILVRVVAELLILFFRINETLTDISQQKLNHKQ